MRVSTCGCGADFFVACNCVVSKKMLTMLCSRLKGDDTNNNEKGVLTQKKKLGNQSGGGDQLGNQSLGTRVGEPQRRRSWGTSIKEPELGTGIWEPELLGNQSLGPELVSQSSWWARVEVSKIYLPFRVCCSLIVSV